MPPDASLIIPYDTGGSRKPRTLQEDVQQIVKQKGAFRFISEAKLQLEKIETINHSDDDDPDHTTDTESETTQETQKRLFVTRNDLTKLYQTSLNEINTLLDLVSWLLSARSKVAQTTMSPALKGGVPVGSAEIKAVPASHQSQNTRQRLNDTSSIVRLQAFKKCSDKLLAASKRLEIEAQHQSKYWDQMAEIRSQGWSVSRLPRDGRTLVAHVASTEAAPQYRNRGLVPFRQEENGDLTIPIVHGTERRRQLAVFVRRGDNITGFYQGHIESTDLKSPLEKTLIQAKERVFEEELFNEASREAQLIASMGAKVRSSSIEIELSPEHVVSITYLYSSSDTAIHSHHDDEIAAFVGNSLRTMLIAEHEASYQIRSQRTPALMVSNPRPPPEYVLVRPILAQLRHNINAFPILQVMRTYQTSLETAGLSFSVEIGKGDDGDPLAGTFQSLRQVTKSLIRISLPSGISVNLNVETQLAPPRFGTQYRSTEYRSTCASRTLQPTSSSKAAIAFVDDVIARDICYTVLESRVDGGKWKVQTSHPLELALMKDGKPSALLTASCHSGTLAISCLQVKVGVTEKAIYSRTESILLGKGGQRRETKKTFDAVIDDWMQQTSS